MSEHYLLYTSEREYGGWKIHGIFDTYDKAIEKYNSLIIDENYKYYNVFHIECWVDDKLIGK